MFYPFDPTFALLIPAIILAVYAQFKVQSTYSQMSQVRSKGGLTGAAAGRKLLDASGLGSIGIEQIGGKLTDNYDPRNKTLHLSDGVYNNDSIAAIGIVAHEVGHAVQDSQAYAPLKIRSGLVPAANIGSQLAIPLFFFGLIFSAPMLMDIGIIAFSIAVAFTLITLPVEFNASRRAVAMLSEGGYLEQDEVPLAKKVLDAAALTYVAATAMAVLNLIRLLALRGSRD
ncbi:MAG: zinc metallopeptidase [bacterium]